MRPFEIYDVFGRIPAPTEQDFADSHQRYQVIAEGKAKGLGGGTYYGYDQDLLTQVKRSSSSMVYHRRAIRLYS